MKKLIISITILLLTQLSFSQKKHSDAVIVGHVVCKGEHIPFLNIVVKGTTIGVATDATGHYRLIDLPLGKLTIMASGMGYKSQEKTVVMEADKTLEVNFEIEEDALGIDEVVVTGDKGASKEPKLPLSLALFLQNFFL